MVLYGYDASVFNSVQGSANWVAYFNNPGDNTLGSINTAYTVGAIVGGFFIGGPTADYLGRKVGMGIGCAFVIVATFMQTFSPRGNIGCFIGGRALIGIGQGIALSTSRSRISLIQILTGFSSCRSYLYWRASPCRDQRKDYDLLADVLLCRLIHLLLDRLCMHPGSSAGRMGLENDHYLPAFLPYPYPLPSSHYSRKSSLVSHLFRWMPNLRLF